MPRTRFCNRVNNSGRNQTKKIPRKCRRQGRQYEVLHPSGSAHPFDRQAAVPYKTLLVIGMLMSIGALTYCDRIKACKNERDSGENTTDPVVRYQSLSKRTREMPYFVKSKPKVSVKKKNRKIKPRIKRKVFRDMIMHDGSRPYYDTYNEIRHLAKNSIVIPFPEKEMIYVQNCHDDPKPKSIATFFPEKPSSSDILDVIKAASYSDSPLSIRWAGKSLMFALNSFLDRIKGSRVEIFSDKTEEGELCYHLVLVLDNLMEISGPVRVLLSVQMDDYVEQDALFRLYLRFSEQRVYWISQTRYQDFNYAHYECPDEEKIEKWEDSPDRWKTSAYFEAVDKKVCSENEKGVKTCRMEPCKEVAGYYFEENYLIPDPIEEHSLAIVSEDTAPTEPDAEWLDGNLPRWNAQHLILPFTYTGGGLRHNFRSKILSDYTKKSHTVILDDLTTIDKVNEVAFSNLCINLKPYAEEGAKFIFYRKINASKMAWIGEYEYRKEEEKHVRAHCGIIPTTLVHHF